MIFTQEQFDFLTTFEQNFNEVLDQRVCRNVGDRAADKIAEIWHSANKTPKRKYTCAQCRFTLLTQVGKAYRADKAERAQVKNSRLKNSRPKNSRQKLTP